MTMERKCSIEGCDESLPPRNRSGMCKRHYHREYMRSKAEQYRAAKVARARAWRQEHPDTWRASERASRARRLDKLRLAAIEAYGGACECCGEREFGFLTIEHRNGVPDRHRRPNGLRISGIWLLAKLQAEGYPDDCTVLCFNCNCGRHHNGGVCPHKQPRIARV